MGYQDLLLVLVSVMLLSLLMVNVNTNVVEGQEAVQTLELEHTAASVAQQFIEEARSKLFDAYVGVIDPDDMPEDFTPYNALGPGGWEDYPNFSDVDDFHNFQETIYVNDIDFEASIEVIYVQDNDPSVQAYDETFHKKMTVTVSSSWLEDDVTLEHVFSYYGVEN